MAILMDDPDVLKQVIVQCRAFNKFIVEHPAPRDAVLWHGSKINKAQIAQVGPLGSRDRGKFRIPKYLSLTEDPGVAGLYNEPSAPILEFKVTQGCLNATPIMHHSKFPQEREWVLPAYTPVKWEKQERRQWPGFGERLVITFKVLDGMTQPIDLPSCLCMAEASVGVETSGVVPQIPVPAAQVVAESMKFPAAPACPLQLEPELEPELEKLLERLPYGDRAALGDMLAPHQRLFSGRLSEEDKDELLDLLEDIYYKLKARRFSHDEAKRIEASFLSLAGLR